MSQEVKFLRYLARDYLRFHLPDEALAVLAELPDDVSPEDKADALSIKVYALYQKQDLTKLVYLGDTLPDDVTLPGPAIRVLCSAYWTAGLKDKTRQLLKVACRHVPTLTELRELYPGGSEFLELLDTDHPPSSLEGFLKMAIKTRLGYHFVLENLIPLVWQCRQVTCCFSDQVEVLLEAEDKLEGKGLKKLYLAVAQILKQIFGVYTAFFAYCLPMAREGHGAPVTKLYLGTEPGLLDRVQELEELYWQTATPWNNDPCWQELMLKEATILGYPECCSQAAASLRAQGKSLERAALVQYLRERMKFIHWPEVSAPNHAYYTFDFYPCSPRCPVAESRGRLLCQPWLMI